MDYYSAILLRAQILVDRNGKFSFVGRFKEIYDSFARNYLLFYVIGPITINFWAKSENPQYGLDSVPLSNLNGNDKFWEPSVNARLK